MEQLKKAIATVQNKYNVVSPAPAVANVKTQPRPIVLNLRSYALNKSQTKFASVGLQAHSGQGVAVQIHGTKKDWVQFEEQEWWTFLEHQTTMLSYFNSDNVQMPSLRIGNHTVQFYYIGSKKVCTIGGCDGSAVCLGGESLNELWTVVPIINMRMSALKSLNFTTFYKELTDGVMYISGDPLATIKDILYSLEGIPSENQICMLELIKYAPEIVECDVTFAEAIQQQFDTCGAQ